MNEKQKLEKVLKENPDPTKWSKWLKVLIRVLIVIASALAGDSIEITDLLTSIL